MEKSQIGTCFCSCLIGIPCLFTYNIRIQNVKIVISGNFSDYMCDQLIQEASKVLKNNHIPLGMAG